MSSASVCLATTPLSQPAELTVLAPDGREDPGALGITRGLRLFGPDSPPGASQAFLAEREATLKVAAPAGRIVDGDPPGSDLIIEVRRATPRPLVDVELPAPLAEPRLDFRVDRASGAFLESFNPSHLRWIWFEGTCAIVLHVLIIWLGRIPLWHYLAMYGAFGFMWSAMQYVHHYGTERHVTRGARNLWIFGPVDALLLNHNWHRAHHEHPTVPWVYLPQIGRSDSPRRGFLPWVYLTMWKGPRKTEEHVENKYAGRIIQ
jgi:hypothetical protein